MFAWVWQPMGSPHHIVIGTCVLVALAVFAYARTFRGRAIASTGLLAMRLAMITTLAVLLMGPSMIPPQSEKAIRTKLKILLDTSESMLTDDQNGISRFEYAQKHILHESHLAALKRDFDVEISGFDEYVKPLSTSSLSQKAEVLATGRITHLTASVSSALTSIPSHEKGTMLLVVSDGHDSQNEPIQSAATLAKSRNIPVHTVALGGQSVETDLAVLAVPMQDYLLPREPGAILVKVYQSGASNTSTSIIVRHGNEELSVPITFKQESVVEVQVPVTQDEPGQYEYSIVVKPIDGEVELANNKQVVFCDVQKQRMRVLILEGQPFWDSKFLAQSLRKDDRIEVTQITQLSRKKRETIITRVEDGKPKVPATAEEWAEYDIVILGQAVENVLQAETARQLVSFVSDHGGHVIFARGMAYDRDTAEGQAIGKVLEKLEPVVWKTGQFEDLSLRLTPTGRSSHWFSSAKMGTDVDQALARLPGFQIMPLIEREKTAAIVLARASTSAAANIDSTGQPAVVRMQFGRGTVVGILGEGLWQWSLLPPELQDLAGFYDTFWTNLIRWLAMGGDFRPGQQVALHLSRTSMRLGDGLTIDVLYKHTPAAGAHPTLHLKNSDNEEREIALRRVAGREPRFRAELSPDNTGVYQLVARAPGMQPAVLKSKFNVYDVNMERLATAANPLSLRMLADHSGGMFFEAEQVGNLLKRLQRHKTATLVPPQLEYIWDEFAIMFMLTLWSGAEWILRRWAGML